MKWFNADRRASQSVATINMLTTVKAFLQHHIPEAAVHKPGGIAAAQNELKISTSSLLDRLGLDFEKLNDADKQVESDEMAEQLDQWFMQDCANRWTSVSNELIFLSDEAQFDLNNPALQFDTMPVVQPVGRGGNLGGAARVGGFDAAALVARAMPM